MLCRRRYDTITNLAAVFGVSERTIRRDIEVLSMSEPIYTQTGRYGGGVYVTDNYSVDKMYICQQETDVLRKLLAYAEGRQRVILSEQETNILRRMIADYAKPPPKTKKEWR